MGAHDPQQSEEPAREQSSRRPARTGAVRSVVRPPFRRVDGEIRFADRRDAGRRLGALLGALRHEDPIVVGIPRGGLPVAAEVARALEAPLDAVVVRKIGAPQNPEYAIGALAEDGVRVLDEASVRRLQIDDRELAAIVERAQQELAARAVRYRAGRSRLGVCARTVVLVDDGLATGHSARAAARMLRERGARRIVLAVPVAAPDSAEAMREWVDDVVYVEAPEELWAIGPWYHDFSATSDDEVMALLSEHTGEARRDAWIEAGPELRLRAELSVPWGAYGRGVIAFAHGSGSRASGARERRLAGALNEAGFATLLVDLLSPAEWLAHERSPDVELLGARLVIATRWLRRQPETARLAMGYLGAGTGSAAALLAAAALGTGVCAVVSRDGRPELAERQLDQVLAPVLLIVGGADAEVLALNRRAQQSLHGDSRLVVLPGADHLLEAPGALERVSRLAIDWFSEHLFEAAPARGRALVA